MKWRGAWFVFIFVIITKANLIAHHWTVVIFFGYKKWSNKVFIANYSMTHLTSLLNWKDNYGKISQFFFVIVKVIYNNDFVVQSHIISNLAKSLNWMVKELWSIKSLIVKYIGRVWWWISWYGERNIKNLTILYLSISHSLS